jgi:hypothetical protein
MNTTIEFKSEERPLTKACHSFARALRSMFLLSGALAGGSLWAAVGVSLIPSSVSNTFNGSVTLQVTGLASGETVVVQKFLDANTNGIVDAGDLLWQQFKLTDGQRTMIGGVTNINVPGDLDGVTGQITAHLNLEADFTQLLVGRYLFVVSSPASHFTALTNSFMVTNFPYAQQISGTVMNNGTNVPNALVLLFQPSGEAQNPQAGAVANNSGAYIIKAPIGAYRVVPFKTNFVSNLSTSPYIALGSGQSIVTNLTTSLIAATQSISGTIVDAKDGGFIKGLLVPLSSDNLLTITSTDPLGNFNARVIAANQWKVQASSQALNTYGYLKPQSSTKVNTSTGSVSGLTISLPPAAAIFYGTVKDSLNRPMPHVQLYARDQSTGLYEADGIYSDINGNYVAGALPGTWEVSLSSDGNPAFTNYVFSQGMQTTFSSGQASQYNFTAISAANHVTGHVQFNGNPIAGVGVSANAMIGGTSYQTLKADTDDSGNYSLRVPNGSWFVSLECSGDNNSDNLDSILGSGNYQCPDSLNLAINNNNGTANFTVQPGSGSGQFTYFVDSGAVTITGYTGSDTVITIPDYIDGLPVTRIDDFALQYGAFTSVTIGNNVTDIGVDAFNGCYNLATVLIPNSVQTLEDGAFINCSALTTIFIPASVTQIGDAPFAGCSALTSITVDGANASYVGSGGVLFDYAQVTLIQYPEGKTASSYAIPATVTRIGVDAFFGCLLTSISIPNSVNTISDYAFAGARLTSVTLPASVTSLGNGPFDATPDLTAINVNPANPAFLSVNGVLFNHTGTILINYPAGKPGTTYAFPSGVTSVGASAFAGCTLTSITIPDTVTSIEDSAFYQCFSLSSVTLGAALANIDALAFAYCPNLTSFYFKGNAPTADPTVFYGYGSSGYDDATVYYLAGTTGWSPIFAGLPTALWNSGSRPSLAQPMRSGGQFKVLLNGIAGQNYTFQMTTNLALTNWTTLYVTNAPANSFFLTDPNATNPMRLYRVLIGP